MYGLAAIAAGNILQGYGDEQAANATSSALGAEYGRQEGFNAQNEADLQRLIPKMGAPALRGDIDKANAPLYASQKQTQMLGSYLGKDLGPNSASGVAGATGDAIRTNDRNISAFGLRRAQAAQGRTLGDYMMSRERLAGKAASSASALNYELQAAALNGGAASAAGQGISTLGQLYTGSGAGSGAGQESSLPAGASDNGDGTYTTSSGATFYKR